MTHKKIKKRSENLEGIWMIKNADLLKAKLKSKRLEKIVTK